MSKKTLLVIEDDAGLQKQLRWSFDAYDVVLADDRESALAQLRRHQPAVVTMELGLPPDPDGRCWLSSITPGQATCASLNTASGAR